MRYSDIVEAAEPGGRGIWYHPDTGRQIEVPSGMDHWAMIHNTPEDFGLSREDVERTPGWRSLEGLALIKGWVRISGPGRYGAPSIDAISIEIAFYAAHWMRKQGLIIDVLNIEWAQKNYLSLTNGALRGFLSSIPAARNIAAQRSEPLEDYGS